MASRILRSISSRPASSISRAFQPSRVTPGFSTSFTRTYASDGATPGQSSNVSNPNAASPEGQEVNQSRATDSAKDQDTASLQNPVSHPEEGGIGGQEETTESQGAMKRDPNEPAGKKKEKVLEYGQNKKLDPADN